MNLGGSIRINKFTTLFLICLVMIVFYCLSGKNLFAKKSKEINLRKLLIGSIQAVQGGGDEVLKISKTDDFNTKSKGKTLEGMNDPVTLADFRSHCAMKQGLHRIFPKLNIISEEDNSKEICPDSKLFDLDPTVLQDNLNIPDEIVDINDVTIWIDPLDATQEFTEKLFQYVTTMVCVCVKGEPIIGIIYNPFTKNTVWAWKDKATSQNLMNIKRDVEIPKNPIITVSRSHAGDVKNVSKIVFGEKSNILTAAGAGYKILQVVYDNATAYFHTTIIKKWDLCAGHAILNSKGGKMTNLKGEDIDYSSNLDVVNRGGILATMVNHDNYIKNILKNKLSV